MRIKLVHMPITQGYVWCEVVAGLAVAVGICFSWAPF